MTVLFAGLAIVTGAMMVAYGWLFRREENAIASRPRGAIGSLALGAPAVVSGKATDSPNPTRGPLTGKDCLYYEHKLQAAHLDVTERRRLFGARRLSGEGYTATIHDVQIGGFFIDDGSGRAFVMPGGGKTDLFIHADSEAAEASTEGDSQQERRVESGDPVTVMGMPHPFTRLMDYLRAQDARAVEHGMFEALLKMRDEGPDFPCFFPGGGEPFLFCGRGYEDSLQRLESDASMLNTVGWLMAGGGLFVLIGRSLGVF